MSPVKEPELGGGRRERRRRELRDRVYDAAIELFLEQGYDRTTMDEIGERADVARTTVFNHFPRKSEFLFEWGARRRAKVAEALRRGHLDDEPIDVVLTGYMRLLAELNAEHRDETRTLMPAAMATGDLLARPALGDTLAEYLRRAQAQGELRADADPAHAGLMLAAAYFATVVGWCDAPPPGFDLAKALLGCARVMLEGLEPR